MFDEVAYLIEHLPSFPSLLQRALDRQPRPVRPFLLSGSTQGAMRSLTWIGPAARGTSQHRSCPRTVFVFATGPPRSGRCSTSRLAVMLWSVVGGTPGYRELCDNEAPVSVRAFPAVAGTPCVVAVGGTPSLGASRRDGGSNGSPSRQTIGRCCRQSPVGREHVRQSLRRRGDRRLPCRTR